MKKMTLSNEGEQLIKKFEGFRNKAYKPVPTEKYFTIAWGHYGPDVTANMVVTEAQAQEMFRNDLRPIERSLNSLGINFRQEQFDSLASFVYNLGIGNFNSSTLKKKIISNAADLEITDQFIRWINAGGKPLLGLKRRRVAEANQWLGKETYYIDSEGNIKKR